MTIVGIIAFKQTPDWAAILGLLLIIIGVVVDVADASLLVGQRTPDESEMLVIVVDHRAETVLFLHASLQQIAETVIDALHQVRIVNHPVFVEVHKLVFCHSILCDDLLDTASQTHAEGILVERSRVQKQDADVARPIVVVDHRQFDTTEVVNIIPGVVTLVEMAVVLFQLVNEVLAVFLQHLFGAVRTDGDIGRIDQPCLRRDADHEFGANAIEVATEIVILTVVRLSPFCKISSREGLTQ